MTLTVYLSGGMKSDWQDRVIGACDKLDVVFIDPRKNDSKDPGVYTPWDLFGVAKADVVLCYLEWENPGGQGIALEAGYALGLGKHVIGVILKESRYWDIVRHAVSIEFGNLDAAIKYLKSLI